MMIRLATALAVLVSALVHLWLWFDGVKDQGTVGALFVVNVVAGVLIAILLIAWDGWEPFLLAAGFGATTIVAFVIAASGELFGIHTGWSWYAWVAFVAELAAVVLSVAGAWREGYARPSGTR